MSDTDDDDLGYIVCELRKGEKPLTIGRPLPRQFADELLRLMRTLEDEFPNSTWELAEIRLITHGARPLRVIA